MKKYGCVNLSRPNDHIFPYLSNSNTERQINDRVHDINDRANMGLRIVTEELGLPDTTMAEIVYFCKMKFSIIVEWI